MTDTPNNISQVKSQESTSFIFEQKYSESSNDHAFCNFTRDGCYLNPEHTRLDESSIFNLLHLKRFEDPSFGSIDFRSLKLSNFSNSFTNKLVESIDFNTKLKSDCITAIAEAAQMFIQKCPLLISNKAATIDPAKWFINIFEKSKFVYFGRLVPVDIDENYLFEAIGLKNIKDRTDKLALVTNFHDAIKSENNARIKQAADSLRKNYFKALMPHYVKLITDIAHKVFWSPIAFEMVPIYGKYFATIPAADWFLYPYYSQICSYFSRNIPNMALEIGPPMQILKKQPFPGNVLVTIGVFLRYHAPLFSKKISFERNGTMY